MRVPQGPIGHVDADCFYVSAERVRLGELEDVPVAVLGNQGACVIARSYEMRAEGVGVGIPIWEALKLSPDGLYIKRDFRWYEVLSRAMLAVVQEFSPRVEYYSIDEFFFESVPPKGMDEGQYAAALRDAIRERVGVPATVGIARTRTLAKLVSDTGKPRGAVAVLDRVSERALLGRLAVTEITGIAGRRERRLQPWGIRSCLDFASADRRQVRKILTATGEALWWELNGEHALPLHPRRPLHKNLSRGGSFGESSGRPSIIWAWLVRNLERLVEQLHYHQILTGRVSAWIGYRDGRFGEGQVALITPTDRFDLLIDAFRPCIRRAWQPYAVAERMQIFAHALIPRTTAQLGLFDGPRERAEAIARLKRDINAKHGRFALRSGATLPLVGVYRDPSNEWDICDVHGKMCF